MRPEYEHNPLNNGSVFPSNGFLWEAFNVKLCTLCLYSGFIFLPVQNIHHQ